ncbi:glycosyltransferase family 39 protein [Streptomyces sp. H27-D2]|uniref:glycosyltransferase family 39 protein n=1 Tax=Streptomyces sp. H27-D2 TaxID=3046304 RepID=UPI002DB67195|nr:glycosyltransferase family 39 protein [Streptomyces sp. H27-D2]MEC4019975.1 glycosyltransferase family 39 protein [Streptomyces sp. H27-D2]
MPETTDAPPAAPLVPSRPERLATALRAATPALLAYAAVRLLGLAILAAWAAVDGRNPLTLLNGRWDSVWYLRIAEHGYGFEAHLPDGGVHSDLAFFPLLPALERGISEISPLTPAGAGLLVGWLASLVAAWGIYAVGSRLYGHRTGLVLAVLWGVCPTAFVQSMAYTETLFTALAAWALYAVLTRRRLWASALAVLAGLTRPSAAAVVAAIIIPAAVTLIQDYRAGARLRALVREHGRMITAACLAPLGWLAYVLYVAVRNGGLFAYFEVQGAWGNGIDGGVALAGFVWEQLTGPVFLGGIGIIAALALLGWLCALCVRQRQPLPLLVYAGVVVFTSLVSAGYFGSRPRLMMPAFPLLLPIAVALARLRPARTALALGALALASGAYGAFTLLGSGPP